MDMNIPVTTNAPAFGSRKSIGIVVAAVIAAAAIGGWVSLSISKTSSAQAKHPSPLGSTVRDDRHEVPLLW